MNGVTGRMGTRQHLVRSIVAIREQGGVPLPGGETLVPEPVLVGRDEKKLRSLAEAYSVQRWSTDLEECLADPRDEVYFDSQTTTRRADAVRMAIAAGKHVYCEKPTATNLAEALELARLARERGVKNGVVQDKLFLPGLIKLKRLVDSGFFGRILSVRGEFGYWVFEGDWRPAQRPSWNYRREEGGGIIVDMLCHWRYVLDNLFGNVRAVSCLGATHIPQRWNETGEPYEATADDAAYATFELEGDIVAHINSSWCVRVNRDELFELQVDGTMGSAVAGLRNCKAQHRANTPEAIWNPDIPDPNDYRAQWLEVPPGEEPDPFGPPSDLEPVEVELEAGLGGHLPVYRDLHEAILKGSPLMVDGVEGRKSLELANAMLYSNLVREEVSLPLDRSKYASMLEELRSARKTT